MILKVTVAQQSVADLKLLLAGFGRVHKCPLILIIFLSEGRRLSKLDQNYPFIGDNRHI